MFLRYLVATRKLLDATRIKVNVKLKLEVFGRSLNILAALADLTCLMKLRLEGFKYHTKTT